MTIDVKFWLKISAIFGASALIAILIINYIEAFSSFGVALLLADIACLKLYLIDKFLLRKYDTLEETAKGNIAPALLLASYAVILLAAIVAAFVIWVPQPIAH